ncbi:hypothetical protein [Streptomyces goshikiensis]|uniref:hypothetical protein n=1 Tax=Streptomyces goshikiensis TaxID=1942 RepID=UPI0033C73DD2
MSSADPPDLVLVVEVVDGMPSSAATRIRPSSVTVSDRLALVGLVLAMSSSLPVVAMVMRTERSAVLVGTVLSGVVWLWFGMPLRCRLRHGR